MEGNYLIAVFTRLVPLCYPKPWTRCRAIFFFYPSQSCASGEIQMPFAKFNGIDMYYEEHGDGPSLVFVHGGGGNHLSWWQQVPVFVHRFRCVTFDHRGFGFSREIGDRPAPNTFVEDLRGLLDHLGIQRTALVAQSSGGCSSLGFASLYPERVAALALCDTWAAIDDPQVMAEWHQRFTALGGLAGVLKQVYAPDYPEREPAGAFLYREISALNLNIPEDLAPVVMGLRYSVEPININRIPTLILVGEQDAITTPKLMERLAERIPHSRFVSISGAGHSVYFERPDEFNRALDGFLMDHYRTVG
jgi:3-oxoadipate enol-lactonase